MVFIFRAVPSLPDAELAQRQHAGLRRGRVRVPSPGVGGQDPALVPVSDVRGPGPDVRPAGLPHDGARVEARRQDAERGEGRC